MKHFESFSKHILFKNKQSKLTLYYIKHIITIIILPIFLFNAAFITLFLNSYINNLNGQVRSVAEKNANILDNVFHNVDTYYKTSISNNSIYLLLNNSFNVNNLYGSQPPVSIASNAAYTLNNYLNCIDSVFLYSEKSDYIYGLLGQTSKKFEGFDDKSWYDEYLKNNRSDYISSVEYNGIPYLTFCYNLNNISSENHGILVIRISQEELLQRMKLVNDNTNTLKLCADDTGNELINYNSESSKSGIEYTVPLENTNATLTYSALYESTPGQLFGKFTLIILFALISFILAILLALAFSSKQYKSIISVISEIEDPYISDKTEAKKLYSLIEQTDTSHTMNNYENMLLNKITHLKKAQLVALQTQINPHFLYNTLCMISASIMANHEEDTDAVNMIELLSVVLRYTLKTEKYIVPIGSEIRVLKSYIEILKLRLNNAFDVSWNVSESVTSRCTLKSLLQPVIENAVEHGIQPLFCSRQGEITVNIYEENDILYLNVTDNGVGIDAENLEKINNDLNSDSIFTDNNIGLKNVVSRIKLLFGDTAGFIIESEGLGTSVTIYHPIIKD